MRIRKFPIITVPFCLFLLGFLSAAPDTGYCHPIRHIEGPNFDGRFGGDIFASHFDFSSLVERFTGRFQDFSWQHQRPELPAIPPVVNFDPNPIPEVDVGPVADQSSSGVVVYTGFDSSTSPVPETGTLLLLAVGLGMIGVLARTGRHRLSA